MALTDKLHALDHRFLPGTRDGEEGAETFLRRVASSRGISPAQMGDVMAALREYFGLEEQGGSADESDESDGSEQKDRSNEQEDESDEKEDDES